MHFALFMDPPISQNEGVHKNDDIFLLNEVFMILFSSILLLFCYKTPRPRHPPLPQALVSLAGVLSFLQ